MLTFSFITYSNISALFRAMYVSASLFILFIVSFFCLPFLLLRIDSPKNKSSLLLSLTRGLAAL